ncbi:MAG: hypothetical protein P1U69_03200 [Parvibaculaceae bacterium]|nr:hypothetical protein [Parvibaculaceae bacterium]
MSSSRSSSTAQSRTTTTTNTNNYDNRVAITSDGGDVNNVSGVGTVIGDVNQLGDGAFIFDGEGSLSANIKVVAATPFGDAPRDVITDVNIVQNITANDPRIAQLALETAGAFLDDTSSLIDAASEGALGLVDSAIGDITALLGNQGTESRNFLTNILNQITGANADTLSGVSDLTEDVLSRLSSGQSDTLSSISSLSEDLVSELASTQAGALDGVLSSIAELRAANENNAAITLEAVDALAATRTSEGSQLVDSLPKLAGVAMAGVAAFYLLKKAA